MLPLALSLNCVKYDGARKGVTSLGTMKRTVELDTLAICDRLHDLSDELHALALVAKDLGSDADLGHALFKIARAVSAIGDEVHQTPVY